MKTRKFIIEGRIPSKKNSRNLFVSRGNVPRLMNLPSNKYAAWHAQASEQVQRQFWAIGESHQIKIDFYMPDNRRCDLTNKAESIMDLLVDTGVLEDDRWQVTGPVLLYPKGIDKKNPRAVVWVKSY